MRVLILICVLGTSLAVPQGYNYQQQQNSFSIGLPQISSFSTSQSSASHASTSHHSSNSQNILQEGQNFLNQAFHTPSVQQMLTNSERQQSYAQPSFLQRPQSHPIIPPSFGIPQPQQLPLHQPQQPQLQQQYLQPHFGHTPSMVTKDIYVHVAPEEPEERYPQHQQLPAPPPRKHYRIVFIKAPTPKISNTAALRLQQAPTEEKTIIYVLTKKPDPINFEAVLQEAAPKPPSKPEVYFIKYKTQAEAQHAQRTIQAQYDKLGGTTQVSDEGVAPVTSVIGSLDHSQGIGSQSSSSGSSSFTSGSGVSTSYGAPLNTDNSANVINVGNDNKYLPPIVRL